MDLIPLKPLANGSEAIDPDAILLSEEAMALADVRTTVAGRSHPSMEINLYGVIQVDQRTTHSLVSHVNGRVEKLNVHFTGETIRKGQTVASLYSPDLVNAQQELLEATKMAGPQPALLHAAREKLRSWKLTDAQITAIEQSGRVSPLVDVIADAGGTVISKTVQQGDYIGQGSVLFQVADLTTVWAMFDAYEADLPYLHPGAPVEYSLPSLPGKTFRGHITFIDPVLDRNTRTAKVRVETSNPGLHLKPEMYAQASITAVWKERGAQIVIPKTSVLWTGKRSIVYLRQPHTSPPAFRLREVELGQMPGGDSYIVVSGISEGEEIVTKGTFAVDAAAQLEGKPSMMNTPPPPPPAASTGKHATLRVEGRCNMCKERIETAAGSIPGVAAATWNGETKLLQLQYDAAKTSLKAVANAIARAGHDNGMCRAADKVYRALPGCCMYRE
jgi:Cu(I)/Ag(I) efflux system membrane fusion protein